MLAIINAELIMRDHLIPEGFVLIEDGKIKDFGEMYDAPSFDGCEIIDAEGAYVGPGLVDIHIHAADDRKFNIDPLHAAKYVLRNGVTTVLPTFSYSMSHEELLDAVDLIRNVKDQPGGVNIGGIYMEGPYLNPSFGTSRASISIFGPADPKEYMELIQRCGDMVRVWAVAPERENIEQFMRDAKAANPNVVFAVAHSEATPQMVEALMPYGLKIGTHHTNATGTIINYSECRGCCVDEAVNYNSEIFAELICDRRGIHVDPYMLRLVRKIKGNERIILVSDCTAYRDPKPAHGFERVDDLNYEATNNDISSRIDLRAACRNMMIHTGASIVDVFNYASRIPAMVTGFTDRGEIRKGWRADLLIVDDKINIKTVLLKGKVVPTEAM